MFEWTEERVSFMADACERTDFHEKLAALLTAVLKNYVQLTYFEPKDNAVRTATFMPTVEEVSIPPVPGSVRWGKGFRITMEEA